MSFLRRCPLRCFFETGSLAGLQLTKWGSELQGFTLCLFSAGTVSSCHSNSYCSSGRDTCFPELFHVLRRCSSCCCCQSASSTAPIRFYPIPLHLCLPHSPTPLLSPSPLIFLSPPFPSFPSHSVLPCPPHPHSFPSPHLCVRKLALGAACSLVTWREADGISARWDENCIWGLK